MNYARQSADDYKKGNLQRRKILSLCHEIGWTYPTYGGKMVVDFNGLDKWMVRYSYLHKPLNYYTPSELPRLVTQFESMAAKELIKNSSQRVNKRACIVCGEPLEHIPPTCSKKCSAKGFDNVMVT